MKKILPLVLLFLIFGSCAKIKLLDLAKEKAEILKLHHTQRNYHFNKDSIAFANQFSTNFISVNKGLITSPKKRRNHFSL